MRYTSLRKSLADNRKLAVSDGELDRLFVKLRFVPQADASCLIMAITYLAMTGDLLGFFRKIVGCLISSESLGIVDILQCLVDFWAKIATGGLTFGAIVALLECVYAPPSPDDGEIPPGEHRDVDRC